MHFSSLMQFVVVNTVSVLGRDEGYTVKYKPLPEGIPKAHVNPLIK